MSKKILFAGDHLEVPMWEISFSFARSGGPGGQNVNKTSSKAILRWELALNQTLPAAVKDRLQKKFPSAVHQDGSFSLQSDRFRDQPRNIEDCLNRLSKMLSSVEYPPRPRIPTKPSASQKRQRLDTKRRHSEKKQRRSWQRD